MMPLPFFSIVIPFYNRARLIERAITSAVKFSSGTPIEIVLVDDGSTDAAPDTVKMAVSEYVNRPNIYFKFVTHENNKGVCAAKNSGGRASSGEWIIFLDSDDELIETSLEELTLALQKSSEYPLHFFGCTEQGKDFVLTKDQPKLRDFNLFLLRGTDGEALPVVKSHVFKKYGFDEDIKGYESLCYLRIVSDYSFGVIHTLIARRYYTDHDDRLSSRQGMKRRWKDLSCGHLRVLKEHYRRMSPSVFAKQILRYVKSSILSFVG